MNRDSHPAHDSYLIAQLAADDLTGPDREFAERLVAACPRCADLLADLRAIASATADLPAPVRPRDFRLTPADAARLRSRWRRWLGGLAEPRFSFAQPLGAALATIGLAGLLLTVLPSITFLGASTTSAPEGPPRPATTRPLHPRQHRARRRSPPSRPPTRLRCERRSVGRKGVEHQRRGRRRSHRRRPRTGPQSRARHRAPPHHRMPHRGRRAPPRPRAHPRPRRRPRLPPARPADRVPPPPAAPRRRRPEHRRTWLRRRTRRPRRSASRQPGSRRRPSNPLRPRWPRCPPGIEPSAPTRGARSGRPERWIRRDHRDHAPRRVRSCPGNRIGERARSRSWSACRPSCCWPV